MSWFALQWAARLFAAAESSQPPRRCISPVLLVAQARERFRPLYLAPSGGNTEKSVGSALDPRLWGIFPVAPPNTAQSANIYTQSFQFRGEIEGVADLPFVSLRPAPCSPTPHPSAPPFRREVKSERDARLQQPSPLRCARVAEQGCHFDRSHELVLGTSGAQIRNNCVHVEGTDVLKVQHRGSCSDTRS